MKKKALITGVSGQDGSYLSEFLLSKGYEVHGIVRRSSTINTARLDKIYEEPQSINQRFFLRYGDLSDFSSLIKAVLEIEPDEIYNLGAQSHVAVSFESPIYTADVNGIGALRILEAVRQSGLTQKTKIYQASTSELFGLVQETPQTELTPFYPRSPYGVAKLMAYWATVNYRESYGMFACNGILFNHESPRRGETFVTKKITNALARISLGSQKELLLGNLNAERDWGHAKDYVKMQWAMLQQDRPQDFVIGSGVKHSVRDFVKWTAEALGFEIGFEGSNLDEVGFVQKINKKGLALEKGKTIVRVSERYFRPAEVDTLLSDPTKAKDVIGWAPQIKVRDLCREMAIHDVKQAMAELLLKSVEV